jgi:hypothetical protein
MLKTLKNILRPVKRKLFATNAAVIVEEAIQKVADQPLPPAVPISPIQERSRLFQELTKNPTDRNTLAEFLEHDLKINDDSSLWQQALNLIDNPAILTADNLYWDYFNARSLLSYLAWDVFAANCRENYLSQPGHSAKIDKTGVIHGKLSRTDLENIVACMGRCEEMKYLGDDFTQDHMFNPWIFGDCAKEFNEFATYLRPSAELNGALEKVLQSMQSEFDNTMGHHWSVISSKVMILKPLTTSIGPHIWHCDSHPACCKKMMIYLSPTSESTGSTEYKQYDGHIHKVCGDGGEWVLFENSRVTHRALPPVSVIRPVIELTFMPAFTTDTKIQNPGINAGYPWFPIPVTNKRDYFGYANTLKRTLLRSIKLALANGNVGAVSAGIDNMIMR